MTDDDGTQPGQYGAEPDSARGPSARLRLARSITDDLRRAIDLVGIDEFYSQEAQFDQDSRFGRELLYLIANDEWSRATRETVSLEASDSVSTSIQIHIDLGRITHEAFRNRPDRVWLPLVVLAPPVTETASHQPKGGPKIAPTPLVRDHTNTIVPPLPQSEARRWIAAAMAEIILNITPAAMGLHAATRQLGREQRLLLSAAIYRVLRQGSDHTSGPVSRWAADSHIDDGYRRGRIQEARSMLGALMDEVSRRLTQSDQPDRSTLLIRRAARVLHAVSSPSTLVVISVEPEAESSVYVVDVPARPLFGVRRPLSAPRAEVLLNVLLPAVDADRAIVVNLPEGLAFVRPNRRGEGSPVHAEIVVDRPRIEWQIDRLLDQLDPPGDAPQDPVARCMVDFALSRMDVARDAYRVYRASPEDAEVRGSLPDRLPESAYRLQRSLQAIRSDPAGDNPDARGHFAHGEDGLQDGRGPAKAARYAVHSHRRTPPPQLFRAHEGDAVSPRRAHIRVPAVENRNVRGTPVRATVRLEMVADDSAPLRAARHAGWMSLMLLAAVLIVTRWLNTENDRDLVDAQVLASVLTLFAVLQAGRIQSPDRATLRGLLISGGSWVIVASILPPVLLGVVLAFTQYPFWVFEAALVSQVLLQVLMYTPPVTGRAWNRKRRPALKLKSERAAPDYARIDVLHSSWWRSTTAAALLLGASAHGYVLPQNKGGVGDLLSGDEPETGPMPRNLADRVRGVRRFLPVALPSSIPDDDAAAGLLDVPATPATPATPANILAMLRAGSSDRSLTFLVFREEPQRSWQEQTTARPVDLDVDRLIAHEAPIGHLDVFIGLPPGKLQTLASHPVNELLAMALDRQLLVLDVQFPSSPPLGAAIARAWTRTRIGVRGDEIPELAGLLTDILDRVRSAGTRLGIDIDLLVDTSTQTPPRRFLGTPAAPEKDVAAVAMHPSALDWRPRTKVSANSGGTRDWLMVAMCQYAASGAEGQIISSMIERHPELELAGLTVAILHGTCIVFALGHQPGIEAGRSGPASTAPLPRDAQLLYEEWVTGSELGQLPDGGLLLQVHAQYSDRPGLFSALIDELSGELAEAAGRTFEPDDVRLSYVHTEVADGRNATTWFMVALPAPASYDRFDRVVLDRIERSGRRVLSEPTSDDSGSDALGLLRAAKAMVSVEVVTVQPAEKVLPAPTAGPAGNGAPGDSPSGKRTINVEPVSGAGPEAPVNTPPFTE